MQLFDNDIKIIAVNRQCAELLMETLPRLMGAVRSELRAQRVEGLSMPQFGTLIFLKHHPGASLSEVSEHHGLSQSAASKLVDGLVKRGLVTRADAPDDRRRAILDVSQRGDAMLEQAHAEMVERLGDRLDLLTPEEQALVLQAMHVLHKIIPDRTEHGKECRK